MTLKLRTTIAIALAIAAVAAAVGVSQLPGIGAGALLFPRRHPSRLPPPAGCVEQQFAGASITLSGWRCRSARGAARATVIYLHGIADNRDSAVGAISPFTSRGYDVIAYDGRAHGRSEGDRCTYGYYEKEDLRAVITQLGTTDVAVIGQSLGAAVALQAAGVDSRIRAVVAASTFSDLRTIATERAASVFFPGFAIPWALARTEQEGRFSIDEVSPLRGAGNIRASVFLIHGAEDRDTSPAHSQRVFDAVRSRKHLTIVPGAGHNDVMRDAVWKDVEAWLDAELANP